MVLIYVTCKDGREAKGIAVHLLKKRLIACANVIPIKSFYWWQGEIANSAENLLIAKTMSKKFKDAEKEIKKVHSYNVPCILRIDATANKEYEKWMEYEIG